MLKSKSIQTKLLSVFLLIGILPTTITGWLCYRNSKSTLEKVYFDKHTSVRETKRSQIETYFDQVRNQIITFSEDHMIVDAMNQFTKAFHDVKKDNEITGSKISQYTLALRDYYDEYLAKLNLNVKDKREIEQYWPEDDEAIILQYHYIANNLNPVGSKGNLEMATDGSQYSRIHSKYHPIIGDYLKRFGYYDIFLVDAQTGHVVYSNSKEVDFATSLLTGPYKDTNLARAFKEARDATNKEFVKLVDFEFYHPSYASPASFLASPIFDGDKEIGVLVFQMPINEINKVMTGNYNWKNEGMGESGETYIVGSDYKMRNDSRFIIEEPDGYIELLEQIGTDKEVINQVKSHSTSIMFQEIHTEAVEEALNGNEGTKIIVDYRGIPVLSSYTPLSIKDVKWVILSEIDKVEVFASLNVIKDALILIVIFVSLSITILAFSISGNIIEPILHLVKGTDDVSKGDFSKRINITQKDEIGKLADTFNKMTDSLIKTSVKEKKVLEELEQSKESLSATNEKLQIEITERKKQEESFRQLAETDFLTNIYNRRIFLHFLKVEINKAQRYSKKFSLIMFDIDHFKAVNDTYGHNVGDYVLKAIVDVIKKYIREADIFARYGGEEFIIIQPETAIEGAKVYAEKMRTIIEQTNFGKVKKITISVGVTMFNENDTIESITKKVDDALYKAKNKGRNRVEVA